MVFKGFTKLLELRLTQGNIAKKEYLTDNSADKEFIECLKFLIDDRVITNISSKKYDKDLKLETTVEINSVFELLEYAKRTTGKDIDIVNIKNFINKHIEIEKEILQGLICKNYTVNFGHKFFNETIKDNKINKSAYMGCIPYNEKKIKKLFESGEVLSQVKSDGQFLNSIVTNRVDFTARSGIIQHINGELREVLLKLRETEDEDFVLTGELLVEGYDRQTANGLIRSLISSNKKIQNGDTKEHSKFIKKYGVSISEIESKFRYVVWDIVTFEGFMSNSDTTPYNMRLARLERLTEHCSDVIRVTEYKKVKSYTEAMKHFKYLLSRNEEGSVLKSSDGIWKDGKPNWQIKMKLVMEIDLIITGFNLGKPKTKYEHTLGSLQVESSDGLLSTNMSGISDTWRDELWDNQGSYLNKIVTVKCNGVSSNRDGGNSLLYPNFIEIREDKGIADSFEDILNIEKAKIGLESS